MTFARVPLSVAILLCCHAALCRAGETTSPLKASVVTLEGKGLTVAAVLEALHKQTGNRVVDARKDRSAASLDLALKEVPFWTALETVSDRLRCGISSFAGPAETVALVDERPGELHVSHDGLFRSSVASVSLTRDFESALHQGIVVVHVAWEPRFRPYYLDPGPTTVVLADRDGTTSKIPGQGKEDLGLARVATLRLRLPAPPRACTHLAEVRGSFDVIGPDRMLTFTFDKLATAPLEASQEGVRVTLEKTSVTPDRWTFTVRIDNPRGGPVFESYQSWLGNNRITLVGGKDRKLVWTPLADDMEVLEESAQRAVVRYHFTDPDFLAKTRLADWTLAYTTPHRIVAVPVRFAMKGVELP